MSEPTQLQPHSISCIDLIFTDQPNLVANCGKQASLIPNAMNRLHIANFISILNIPYHMCC